MNRPLRSLDKELRQGLLKRVVLPVVIIGLIGIGLHGVWSIQARKDLEDKTKKAVAHTLQEPIRNRDLISMQRMLQAFTLANENVSICVRLPGGTLLENRSCVSPEFERFRIPLTGEEFEVSVTLPWLDSMSLGGLPFLVVVGGLLLMVSRYLSDLTRKVTDDLNGLASTSAGGSVHFSEISEAKAKIHDGLMLKTKAMIGEVATQVAHDIRSPLAAFSAIEKEFLGMAPETRKIARNAVARIQDIANDLLNKHSTAGAAGVTAHASRIDVQFLPYLISTSVSEKRVQYRDRADLEIGMYIDEDCYTLCTSVNAVDLRRVISNLVNNSVEAMDDRGQVEVRVSAIERHALIRVRDFGKGISPEILAQLNKSGGSFGKPGGNGLGLLHAKRCVEEWGGRFEISSEVGKGTCVSIYLPSATPPSWLASRVVLPQQSTVVILDDDASMHQVWRSRMAALKGHRVDLLSFFDLPSFESWIVTADVSQVVFLVDYELGDENRTGLDVIRDRELAATSLLVTSRFDEAQIQNECVQSGIQTIPKMVASKIPILLRTPAKVWDALLVDDDELVRSTWRLSASKFGKELRTFTSPAELTLVLDEISKETAVYVDVNLESGVRGELFAKQLFESGFKNLYLATGYEARDLGPIAWVKGIVSKDPPWQKI